MLLGGCVVGPGYRSPNVRPPVAFAEPTDAGARGADLAAWWTGFDDPTLTDLVTRSLTANPDIRVAATRIRQARAEARIAGAGRLPTLNASGQAAHTRLSENAVPGELLGLGTPGGSPASALGIPGLEFDTYQVGFDAAWELDLFGGQRRAVEAATARTLAAEWSARDAEVLVGAEVANSYLQYRALQRRIAIAETHLAAERELLDFVRTRARHGIVTSLDERRQEREIEQLAATREDLIAQRAGRLHALGVLLGEPPMALAQRLAAPPPAPATPPQVPPGLPSELLLRRPDLRAAERRLAAAVADQGVAVADLYPRISLTGAAQLISLSLASLLEADSLQLNAAGRASLPLFDGGQRRATVSLREAQAQEALVAYDAQVLTALKEVEDALSRLGADRRRLAQLRAAEQAARDAADTTQVRYRNGLIPFLDVLEARQSWLTTQDAVAQADASAAQDAVALYKALGGGWDARRAASAAGEPLG
ncbi:efflux transporter outer membrane subunit [Phenylobacterium sp. LjRoot219]|uniref:efflux transporter outer membrane subunit n=1 Tax=Phenylobacterium sp. LjRoot219 TaxID=3342283 RepID=UPI003ECC7277